MRAVESIRHWAATSDGDLGWAALGGTALAAVAPAFVFEVGLGQAEDWLMPLNIPFEHGVRRGGASCR